MPSAGPALAAFSRPLVLTAVAGGMLVGATGWLWAYYGTTVFLEVVRAGWSACF